MLDYEIIQIFRPIIIDGLSGQGISSKVLMNYQPTKQGKKDNEVYFFIVNDRNVGSVERIQYWDSDLETMVYNQSQTKETTFQINTLVKQDPANLTITSKDLCTYVHMILQSKKCLDILKQNNIGILKVTEIRNTPFEDGDGNWAYNPNFDFTITHKHTLSGELPTIDNFNDDIKRV